MAKSPEPKPANIEEESNFIVLRAQGKSYIAIAEAMGIGRGKALELGRRLRLEVGLEAALFRQVILEQSRVTANHRAAAFAEVLGAVFKELAARVRGDGFAAMKMPELLAMANDLESRLLREERPAQVVAGWNLEADVLGEVLDMA